MGEKWTLAKHPCDNAEQILIVIPFKWRLAGWWMGANLPLCQALERVFNMTIKCLSFGFYCICPSLSSEPPSSSWLFFLLSTHSPSPLPIPRSSQHFICTVQLLHRLNWDSSFLHLRALTYVLWHALSQFYVVIDFYPLRLLPFCLNRHKPFCLAGSSDSSADLWQRGGKKKQDVGENIFLIKSRWTWTFWEFGRFSSAKTAK